MSKYRPKYKVRRKRPRSKLMATNAGPIVLLAGTILAILLVIALTLFVLLPWLLPLIGIDYRAPFSPTPVPVPTPVPTATPHPITAFDAVSLEKEIVLPRDKQQFQSLRQYPWFGNPMKYGNTILFTIGKLEGNNALMSGLCSYDIDKKEYSALTPTLTNGSYFYPVMNDKWLVYLDAKVEGGGTIRVVDLKNNKEKTLKQVYVGLPKLILTGDKLVWTERTGTKMDKLFVCDLTTFETVTVEMFENSQYGMSEPSACQTELIWAGEDADQSAADAQNKPTSAIYSLKWGESSIAVFKPDTYVHDPVTNGKYWIWTDSNHSETSNLYFVDSSKTVTLVEKEVTGYGLGDNFAAYAKNQKIWLYFFGIGTRYCLTPAEAQQAQFLGVSGDTVFWMDVSSRDRDILKYAQIPESAAASQTPAGNQTPAGSKAP